MSLVRLGLRKDIEGSLAREIEGGYNLLVSELVSASRSDVPEFVDMNDVEDARARNHDRADRHDTTYHFGDPTDAEFQEFVDAYREKQPWRERKKFMKELRKKK